MNRISHENNTLKGSLPINTNQPTLPTDSNVIKTILNFVPQSRVLPLLISHRSLPQLYMEAISDRLNLPTYPLTGRIQELETILDTHSKHTLVFRALAARLNLKDFGGPLLVKMLEHQQNSTIAFLLNVRGFDPSTNNNEALDIAGMLGNLYAVKLMAEDKRTNPTNAMIFAAGKGHLNVVKHLVNKKQIAPSLDENAALRFAAGGGHIEVVRFLLSDKRVDLLLDNCFAIHKAIDQGHDAVAKLMLKDPRVDAETRLECIRKLRHQRSLPRRALRRRRLVHLRDHPRIYHITAEPLSIYAKRMRS